MEELLRKIYYSPETGFTGVEKLLNAARKVDSTITRKNVKSFLDKQEIHQTTKKTSGKLGSFIPHHPLQEFQIDLIYLENKHLNKASYGLVAIDAFSKRATVKLLKSKTAEAVVQAMQEVFEELGVPESIYADEGSEFNNELFKELMDKHKIELILTLRHATIAERFNRTIKELMYKYLQSTNTKTITNVLPQILKNYNNSFHKTIGMAPNEVSAENRDEVYQNIRNKGYIKIREEIKPGDRVRVLLKRKGFEKGYKPKFSKTVYTVAAKDGKYYSITGLNRKYLRAFIEKVGEVQKNPIPAELSGTLEGHLKAIGKLPVDPDSVAIKQILEEEREKEPLSKTRSRRFPIRTDLQPTIPLSNQTQKITDLLSGFQPQENQLAKDIYSSVQKSESEKISDLLSGFLFNKI